MLQDKQEEMNEYINELDHMVIERSNLIEKTNTQSDIINTLQNEVKSVKNKFRELVRLSEEYKEEMESKLEEKIKIETEEQNDIIEKLNKDIRRRQEEVARLENKATTLEESYNKRKEEIIRNIEEENNRRERECNKRLNVLKEEIERLENAKVGYALLQEIDMMENPYNYETSQEFQDRLNEIKKEQKEMVRDGKALVFSTTWTVANSKTKGDKFMKNLSKLALKSFNNECDNIIINVKYSSMSIAKDKIEKSFKDTNKFIQVMDCNITDEYLELKIKELQLKCGWLEKREEEKEELKRQAEILREQEKLEKEIKLEEEKIEIEQQHFNNEIANLENQIANGGNEDRLKKEIAKLQAKIDELEGRKATVLERKMHNKAGYVYIISNPSLEGMLKIGTTRRLDPMVRVEELASASVPFKFAVHSFIFAEDAFALEHTLHMAFDNKRVNKINRKKEFFNVTLDEVKEEVFKHNPNAEFIDEAIVEDYVLSLEM
jgi:chromosome segregation ATPase